MTTVTLFNDTFAGTLNSSISSHTSDSGHTWTANIFYPLVLKNPGVAAIKDAYGDYGESFTSANITTAEFFAEIEFDWTTSGVLTPPTWRTPALQFMFRHIDGNGDYVGTSRAMFYPYRAEYGYGYTQYSDSQLYLIGDSPVGPEAGPDPLGSGTHTVLMHFKQGVLQSAKVNGTEYVALGDNWTIDYWASPSYLNGVNYGIKPGLGIYAGASNDQTLTVRRYTIDVVPDPPPSPFWQDYRLTTETVA